MSHSQPRPNHCHVTHPAASTRFLVTRVCFAACDTGWEFPLLGSAPHLFSWWVTMQHPCPSEGVTLRCVLYTASQGSPVGLSPSYPQW